MEEARRLRSCHLLHAQFAVARSAVKSDQQRLAPSLAAGHFLDDSIGGTQEAVPAKLFTFAQFPSFGVAIYSLLKRHAGLSPTAIEQLLWGRGTEGRSGTQDGHCQF